MTTNSWSPRRQRRRRVPSPRDRQSRPRVLPQIEYDSDLPIHAHLDKIENLLKEHQVLVIAGEPGSGKTTQLPLACMKAGFGVRGTIGHTQPRRLAARAVAQRLATLLRGEVGNQVGYAVRFSEKWSPRSFVKVMTDGLLLAEIQHDRDLERYDCLIIDEAHERSLNVDFLLGYVKRLLPRRPKLRVLVTSATIDVAAFSRFFDDAPVVVVEGRGHAVEVRYRPPQPDLETTVFECLREAQQDARKEIRDILMFLASEREIVQWSGAIRNHFRDSLEILPLYARLPPSEQQRIYQLARKQRVLLATNVAETSLTVPNIRFVIDLGTARISRYSLRSQVQRLPIEQISQASALQRTGRCGRLGPGICYRIYSEDEFEAAPKFTEPALIRTSLAAVTLQVLHYRLGRLADIPFLDPPSSRSINEAESALADMQALRDGRLTKIGSQLAQLPLDPRLSRMLVEGARRGALRELIIIVTALTVQDPRVFPPNSRDAAAEAHRNWEDKKSDFLGYVKLWEWAEKQRRSLGSRAFRRLLDASFVSNARYFEWRSLHRQVVVSCQRLGLKTNAAPASYRAVHSAILAGSFNYVGAREDRSRYRGPRSLEFSIFPGSALAQVPPKWLVAGEIVETARTYARCVAQIQSSWIESVAQHLLKYRFYDAHWDEQRQEAMILADGTLYGLPVSLRKRRRLADIDPDQARALLVRYVFVQTQHKPTWPFLQHNINLRQKLLARQDKIRKSDLIAPRAVQESFYLERIPAAVLNLNQFEAWHRNASRAELAALRMKEDDLLLREDDALTPYAFPGQLVTPAGQLRLSYRFAPGEPDDGVSVIVNESQLHDLRERDLEWLVPGMLAEKVLALLRALPKQTRKRLIPLADSADRIVGELLSTEVRSEQGLLVALTELLRTRYNVAVSVEDWRTPDIGPHLEMNIKLVDARHNLQLQGRDLVALRRSTVRRNVDALQNAHGDSRTRKLTQFPEEGIPRYKTLRINKREVLAYPTLHDRETHVELKLAATPDGLHDSHQRGVCRLILLRNSAAVRYLKREFRKEQNAILHFASLGSESTLLQGILLSSAKHLLRDTGLPTSMAEFDTLVATSKAQLIPIALDLMKRAREVLAARIELLRLLETYDSKAFSDARDDIAQHLNRLVTTKFPYDIPFERQQDTLRYIHISIDRLKNLAGRVSRDSELTKEIQAWELRLAELTNLDASEAAQDELRFQIEEYRVWLFDQRKTKIKMSPKRIRQVVEDFEKRWVNS